MYEKYAISVFHSFVIKLCIEGMEDEVSSGSLSEKFNEVEIENEMGETGNIEIKIEDPRVRMTFNSINEIYEYYAKYAKQNGFAVSKKSSKKAGIRMNKNFTSLVFEARGHDKLSFLEKDCRNHMEKVRHLQLGEGDANAMYNYFVKMQFDNSDFIYVMDLNEEGRLQNVFWADARSRVAFKEFGDVVTFDTTYLVNKYDMPFAHFVGVNHHG
ncbi:hypothetical protein ACSBR1_016516 [Camellia fascicularis]